MNYKLYLGHNSRASRDLWSSDCLGALPKTTEDRIWTLKHRNTQNIDIVGDWSSAPWSLNHCTTQENNLSQVTQSNHLHPPD